MVPNFLGHPEKKNRNVTNYTLFFNTTPTEFNAQATFFWQTVKSTKIEIFGLPLQPLLDRPVSDSPTVFSLARRQISLAFLAERDEREKRF